MNATTTTRRHAAAAPRAAAAALVLLASMHLCAPARAQATAPLAVHSIVTDAPADLVLIRAGHDNGLRNGMTLRVSRNGHPVGELLLVELRRQAAAALILSLEPNQTIQPGDTLALKLVKI
jgi:hypothetical protein